MIKWYIQSGYDLTEKDKLIMKLQKDIEQKDKRIKVLEGINEELNNINAELKKDKMCLHCDSGLASYCESCYQELIGINAKLQKENKNIDVENKRYEKLIFEKIIKKDNLVR